MGEREDRRWQNLGEAISFMGSPEARIHAFVKENGPCTPKEVEDDIGSDEFKVGWSEAMERGWIKVDEATEKAVVGVDEIVDEVRKDLQDLAGLDKAKVDAPKKRELI